MIGEVLRFGAVFRLRETACGALSVCAPAKVRYFRGAKGDYASRIFDKSRFANNNEICQAGERGKGSNPG
jgi:hypothetical protein